MGPSWREGSWGDGWGCGPAACQHRRCLGMCRGLQGAAAGVPAPLPTAEPLPAHSCWCLSPAALVIRTGDKRALACSHGNGRQSRKPSLALFLPPSSPAVPPPASACFHSVSFGCSLIPGEIFVTETAPAAHGPRCSRSSRPRSRLHPSPGPAPSLCLQTRGGGTASA